MSLHEGPEDVVALVAVKLDEGQLGQDGGAGGHHTRRADQLENGGNRISFDNNQLKIRGSINYPGTHLVEVELS